MLLAPGTRLGPYEILSPLGAGGMGEVYRAKDTRLGREVAIKVLPEHLSAQPEVRARFEREAKTVSSLNHPNICALYDVGKEGEIDFLVLELVEGETLEARLARGRVPTTEALRLGGQIADALDRAHRAGVIHRDLKPSNVMLTRAGAKLMDFGLARATGMAGPSGATMGVLTQSPSVARALTAEGTLLGTFQYMSPEQLEGREADARSDIWSLGCVLYELFTGRRAFEGRSQASLIAAILDRDPAPIGEPPSGAPPPSSSVAGLVPPLGIERLIRNCLAKDPEERVQTAHDVRLQLKGIAEGAGLTLSGVASGAAMAGVAAARAAGRPGARVAWMLAALGFVLAGGVFAWLWPRAHAPTTPFRFRIGTVAGAVRTSWPRVSPDGRYLLFLGVDSLNVPRAYTRRLDEIEAHPVPGTEALSRPYWSPDGREIVFVSGDKLQRVPIAGGSPTVICDAGGGFDLSWGAKGFILIDKSATDSLRIVPAGGGDLVPASHIDRKAGEIGSAWPCFLPDGEHFLFIGNSPSLQAGHIRLGRIGSLDSKLLGDSDGRVEYAPGGWVLFLRGTTLLAQKLDLAAGKLTGPPITIAGDIRIGNAAGQFSASSNGILAYGLDDGGGGDALQAGDRAGKLEDKVLVHGFVSAPDLSPDGHKLLYVHGSSSSTETGEIYVFDLDRGTDTRLTFTGGLAFTPHWSPDGRRFAYVANGRAGDRIQIGSADGLGAEDSIPMRTAASIGLEQWTADGRFVFQTFDDRAYTVSVDGPDRTVHALVDTTQDFHHPAISPDGRFVAGTVGAIGPLTQVFVQSIAGAPGRWQISATPASRPRWTKGGSELVFEGRDARMMAVDLDTKGGFRVGTPRPLFSIPIPSPTFDLYSWTCDPGGTRFIQMVPATGGPSAAMEIVSDFHSLVSRK